MARPTISNRFEVSINISGSGLSSALTVGFSSISNISSSLATVPYRTGTSKSLTPVKFRGLRENQTMRFERGVDGGHGAAALLEWFNNVTELTTPDESILASISVQVKDRQDAVVSKFTLRNAWPSSFQYSGLSATSSSIFINSMEISYDEIEFQS
jgi:phage tail-like protein